MTHTERLYLLVPLVLLLGLLLVTVGVYGALCASGHTPESKGAKNNVLLGPFWGRYVVWLLGPLERLLSGRISPNGITALSLVGCLGSAAAVALGHLITGVWLLTAAGLLDIMDGRIARSLNRQTKSGALFDSVSDRWGELAVMGGYTWFLRETPWMIAALVAAGASMMVSYTRARGEGLGLDLHGGWMQRAERIMLVCVGTFAAAWLGSSPSTRYLMVPVVGASLALCGVGSLATALNRWLEAFRALAVQDAKRFAAQPQPVIEDAAPVAAKAVAKARPAASPSVTSPSASFSAVPKRLRESAELGL